ncbi:MAG: HD domain-containing protein [Spirochaetaceae bacterium]|nr:HD domain-containing protein [Spirochaetaceae bacterium]MBP5330137.1 HD domain-containing protein [Spirochaetaceae bacterium]
MGKFSQAVRDSLWGHIYLTPELEECIHTPVFNRLYAIKQLGPTEIAYPGATHTRASHSLGVYHIAQRLADNLITKGASEWVTKKGTAAFLAAALFHDLGHFPFTHSLKELPLKDHEDLTADAVLAEPLKTLIAKTGADPQQVAAIVSDSIQTSDTETLFFRKLLSGVLDPDKLDYLNRDAFFCGVPYGTQDIDFILSHIVPEKEKGVMLDSQGIMSIEHLLFSKYMMYKAVYWNKNVRTATAMMKKALYSALEQKLVTPEQLYAADDNSIYSLLMTADFAEKKCAQLLKERRLYRIIQEIPFDDANPLHKKLEELEFRTNEEKRLATENSLKPEDIIIDVPERISFETDLWIYSENKPFSESSTVFSKDTVQNFTKSIRKIRVCTAPDCGILHTIL